MYILCTYLTLVTHVNVLNALKVTTIRIEPEGVPMLMC